MMHMRIVSSLLASLLILAPLAAAHAGCSRTIRVPAAPTGASVIISDEDVSGAIPDALRELGARMGCTFEFPVMPRARLTYQFMQSREADVLVPASRTPERDRDAMFIPMMKWKVELITVRQRAIRADSVGELLAQKKLMGVAVRSYAFGNEYNALLRELEAQQRIHYVNDLVTAGRLLRAGRADFTINVPPLFLSALQGAADMDGIGADLAFQPLAGMPMTESGAYISRRSLPPADQRTLRTLFAALGKGVLWRHFNKYYSPEQLAYAIVPR
ncbi:hypothetical protein GCM10027277_42440 [Pseudoduganella ginsengisoli]